MTRSAHPLNAKENRLCALLGTKYPLMQGAMAWVADARLAAAVSNGGGLGIIASGAMPPDLLEKEIESARRLTDRPFGLNLMLMSPTVSDALDIAEKYRVPVVTTGAGSPGKVLKRLKPLGVTVIPIIASVALARRVERQGADAVVAEGTEAGGHIGELTTMTLVPQVADAVDIPVIAAGGIADGRGVAAAFALGADGVQMGTRFICCSECTAHAEFKQAILEAQDRDTVITGVTTGHPIRCLRNRLTAEFEKMEARGASAREIEELGIGKLRAGVVDGDAEWGSLMAGQCSGMVNDIRPAAEIIEGLFSEAGEILKKN
ncbi:MAG: enoyl-[acyl-carrier-protein] reductase FabK [Synergistaceae bacterium]|jgi:enoyl-[acyl-carrier protein] reductase II|nr:enoyl-[acyl-carrier-protein] reductase FabK [Synergistaceae bacterium]